MELEIGLDGPAAQEQVEEMLRRSDSFHSIEEFIDSADVHPNVKAALWLFAWSEQDEPRRRAVVREALTATARPQG